MTSPGITGLQTSPWTMAGANLAAMRLPEPRVAEPLPAIYSGVFLPLIYILATQIIFFKDVILLNAIVCLFNSHDQGKRKRRCSDAYYYSSQHQYMRQWIGVDRKTIGYNR